MGPHEPPVGGYGGATSREHSEASEPRELLGETVPRPVLSHGCAHGSGGSVRGLAQDLSLLTQVPDLTAQPAQLITLGGGEAVGAPAGIQVGALDPLADRGLG